MKMVKRDSNLNTATHLNTDAVEYEQSWGRVTLLHQITGLREIPWNVMCHIIGSDCKSTFCWRKIKVYNISVKKLEQTQFLWYSLHSSKLYTGLTNSVFVFLFFSTGILVSFWFCHPRDITGNTEDIPDGICWAYNKGKTNLFSHINCQNSMKCADFVRFIAVINFDLFHFVFYYLGYSALQWFRLSAIE